MLKIHRFVFNPFDENTYVVYDTDTREAVVVDPGMLHPDEIRDFDRFIVENDLKLRHIVNTHLHLDHCFSDNYVKGRYGVDIAASADDAALGDSISQQAARFGLRIDTGKVVIDKELRDGDVIKVGRHRLDVIKVPGHSPGGIAIYSAENKVVLVGDSLFEGSIGRTDLPGGDYVQLVASIKDKLMSLPSDTAVLPGHGEFTTIGKEKSFNPYIR